MSLKSSFWLRSFSSSRASSYLLHYRKRIIHYRFDLEEGEKKATNNINWTKHQAKWSLLGCQNIIHGFQFLGLDGDVHLVWLLILKQIHLPPNFAEVKKKINYQISGKRPSSKEHPKGYSSNTHPFRSWWFILCSQHIPVKRAHTAWDTKPRGDMQEVLGLGRHTYGLTHIVSQGRSFLPFVQEPSGAKEGTSATNTNKDTTNPTNTTNIYLPGTVAVLPASQSPSSAASEGR